MAQVQTANGSGAAAPAQIGTTSLYVGDLDLNVTDSQLFEAFSQMGQVVSVRVCRDLATRKSLGYGYVNFANPQDAARAIQEMNFMPLYGKPIRVLYSHRDPSVRRSGAGNIFIKNLDLAIDHKALHDTFSTFGNIVSCKVAVDASGQSKGYGFVQYADEESAQKAIEKLNGMLLNDKQVYVGPFLRRQERDSAATKTKFTNVYVKNLGESTTDDDLMKAFSEYGKITSAVVMKDGEGKSKGFGFVNFENADDAARAVSLNGHKFDDKEWYVGRAQKKSERETELRVRYEQNLKEAAEKFQSSNLYVKNLDPSISDEKLKEIFSPFGTVTSCKVMRDPSGISKGSGFVAFSTPEEATEAMSQLSGKMVESKPLYVAIAQRKEDRRVRLQAQFSQVRPVVAMPPSAGPRMPMFPPGAPGIGQQMFYGQAPPTMIPPQPGYGYQQQLVPGMRPGGGHAPNYFMPMVQQHQQRPGGGRRPGGIQQFQQQPPMMQHQMHPRGRNIRYSQGRGGSGGEAPPPYDMGNNTMTLPIGTLASNLANASPEQQRTMLGENLYPLVEKLEAESAAKVTGMLLEMDQTEVLHLLESPEALEAKVAEAMDVLRSVAAGGAAEQLASLNLS